MAYSTPPSKSTSNVIGATDWNLHVDDIRWLAENGVNGAPHCRAYRSSAVAIANNTFVPVSWNADDWDNTSVHSTAVNPSRFTAPVDGIYALCANVHWATNANGIRICEWAINGVGAVYGITSGVAHAIWDFYQDAFGVVRLDAGMYAEVIAYQSSGGNLNIQTFAWAWMKWISTK